jgi:hypothetical protein
MTGAMSCSSESPSLRTNVSRMRMRSFRSFSMNFRRLNCGCYLNCGCHPNSSTMRAATTCDSACLPTLKR